MSAIECDELLYNSVEPPQGGGGASVIPLVKVRLGPAGTNMTNGGTNWTQKNVFDSAVINQGGFNVSTSEITVPEDGIYYCYANVGYIENTTQDSSYRWSVWHRWVVNGAAQPEEARGSYCRDASGHYTASTSLATMYQLNQGSTLRLQFYHGTGFNGNDCTLLDFSHVLVYKIAE